MKISTLVITCIVLSTGTASARDVTITAHCGATLTWRGFGVTALDDRWGLIYGSYSTSGKEKLRRMLVDTCNVRMLRADWYSHHTLWPVFNPAVYDTRGRLIQIIANDITLGERLLIDN